MFWNWNIFNIYISLKLRKWEKYLYILKTFTYFYFSYLNFLHILLKTYVKTLFKSIYVNMKNMFLCIKVQHVTVHSMSNITSEDILYYNYTTYTMRRRKQLQCTSHMLQWHLLGFYDKSLHFTLYIMLL